MHPIHVSLLIVLLLIPNTTWQDWRAAKAPHLQQILRTGGIAVMNDRTAEVDAVTPAAGMRTLLSGARMSASADTSGLDYPVSPRNLVDSLASGGVAAEFLSPATAEGGGKTVAVDPSDGFIVATLPGAPASDDEAIGAWQKRVSDANGLLVIASPNPSPAEYKNYDQLAPIVFWRPSGPSGLLYSPSTHTSGLITNTDVAPTIAQAAGVNLLGPKYGFACSITPSGSWSSRFSKLSALGSGAARQARAQLWVPYFALYLAALIALGTFLLQRGACVGRFCAFAALWTVLLLVCVPQPIPFLALVLIGTLLLLLAEKAALLRPSLITTAAIGIAVVIVVDAAGFKAALTSNSLLGYSAVEGARYYGLGDEVMGILIGATTLATGALTGSRRGVWIGAAVWLFIAVILGLPTIGAKAGGLLVGLIGMAAYLAANLRLIQSGRPWKTLLLVAITIVFGLAALVAMAHFGRSHVSQAVMETHRHGFGVIWSIIHRKAAMDLHLMFHSLWMLVLLTSAASVAILRPSLSAPPTSALTANHIIFWTGGIATAACLVLNDAGVVAAALCAVFPCSYHHATTTTHSVDLFRAARPGYKPDA